MFWIHGGCFVYGASDEYDGQDLVSEDVIVVTINYRLGVFGFLGADELTSRDVTNGTTGNYGTLDCIKALEWIQNNIASFGGNASNVTIFGESAGSSLVASLLAAPDTFTQNADGSYMFHGAIIQSGGFVNWSSIPMTDAQT